MPFSERPGRSGRPGQLVCIARNCHNGAINAINSILNYLDKMRLREVYKYIVDKRPDKNASDAVWNEWFDDVCTKVTDAMHTLPEDEIVLKVNGKIAELQLAHGGVMEQVVWVWSFNVCVRPWECFGQQGFREGVLVLSRPG